MTGGLFLAEGERGGIPVLPDAYGRWGIWQGVPTRETPRVPGPSAESPEPEAPPPAVRRGPSFCMGGEEAICGPPTATISAANICRAGSNLLCLIAGLGVLFALLGLSINALLRG